MQLIYQKKFQVTIDNRDSNGGSQTVMHLQPEVTKGPFRDMAVLFDILIEQPSVSFTA